MLRVCLTMICIAFSSAALAQSTPSIDTGGSPAKAKAARTQADCEKLMGVARDTCMTEARASSDKTKQPGTGGTSGVGGTDATGAVRTPAQPNESKPSATGGGSTYTK